MMITEQVRDVYVARWGQPSRKARFEAPGGLVAEVYKWDAGATSEGVTLYATIGASAYEALERSQRHRVEYHVGLLPANDSIASSLAALALYSTRENKAIGHGDTVPSDIPIFPGSPMKRFLVIGPTNDIIEPVVLADGTHIEFMQAIPIYESELAFMRSRDVDQLLKLWSKSKVRFWDPDRSAMPRLLGRLPSMWRSVGRLRSATVARQGIHRR